MLPPEYGEKIRAAPDGSMDASHTRANRYTPKHLRGFQNIFFPIFYIINEFKLCPFIDINSFYKMFDIL